jgi:hypothetical protein
MLFKFECKINYKSLIPKDVWKIKSIGLIFFKLFSSGPSLKVSTKVGILNFRLLFNPFFVYFEMKYNSLNGGFKLEIAPI